MAYIRELKYKITGVAATTATLQPEDATGMVNDVTQIVITWATARPVEFAVDKTMVRVRVESAS